MSESIPLRRSRKGIPRRKHSEVGQQGTQVHAAPASSRCVMGGGEVGADDASEKTEDQGKEQRLDAVSTPWLLSYQSPVNRK